MAQLKYLDLTGLQTFWNKAKEYIDGVDTNLQSQITNITNGTTGVPVKAATDSVVGGVLSGGDITVAGTGAVTVNQAAKWKTPRKITFTAAGTGGITGEVTFDGSQDTSVVTTLNIGTSLDAYAKKAGDTYSGAHTFGDGSTVTIGGGTSGTLTTAAGSTVNLANATSVELGANATATTQGASDNSTKVATTAFVTTAINNHIASAQALEYKGTATPETATPVGATVGDLYIVSEAGTIFENYTCEKGDMIVYDGANWNVIQANIDGAVVGPASAVADNLAVFSGATGKVIADSSITKASVESAITASGTAVQTITVPAPTGDANPTAQKSGTGVTIQLPAYLLKSTYDTAIAGISGTIKDYVDAAVADATISAEGVINHSVGDSAAETVKIADNVITISLKNYALASAVTALEAEVDANTGKLADVTSTVGALIDSKISAAVGDAGTVDTAIDDKLTEAVAESGVVATAIDTKITSAIDPTTGSATAGEDAYIPTVAVTSGEIESMFGA